MPKSKHQIPGRIRSAYEFIKAHRAQYSVQMMCRVLEVAPSGYYDWLLQPVSKRQAESWLDGASYGASSRHFTYELWAVLDVLA